MCIGHMVYSLLQAGVWPGITPKLGVVLEMNPLTSREVVRVYLLRNRAMFKKQTDWLQRLPSLDTHSPRQWWLQIGCCKQEHLPHISSSVRHLAKQTLGLGWTLSLRGLDVDLPPASQWYCSPTAWTILPCSKDILIIFNKVIIRGSKHTFRFIYRMPGWKSTAKTICFHSGHYKHYMYLKKIPFHRNAL